MIRHMVNLLWPIAALFVALTALAFIAGADWPSKERGDFALIVFIVAFKVLISSVILRRMHGRDWLSLSFVAMFLSVASVFVYRTGVYLWPEYTLENETSIIRFIRLFLLVAIAWATVQILRTPDPEIEQRRRRAVQRARGHAAGRVEGHAEGVAQEQADQLEREELA